MKKRNRNRSALGPKLHDPASPATKEIALSAAEAEGCRALWAERLKAVKDLQAIEVRLTRAITSVVEAHGVPPGTQVTTDFQRGVVTVPAHVLKKAPSLAARSAIHESLAQGQVMTPAPLDPDPAIPITEPAEV